MYIVINQTNAYAPEHSLRFNTEAEAEAKATEMLNANPGHVVVTGKLLKTFKATVTIDSSVVEAEAPAEQPAE